MLYGSSSTSYYPVKKEIIKRREDTHTGFMSFYMGNNILRFEYTKELHFGVDIDELISRIKEW